MKDIRRQNLYVYQKISLIRDVTEDEENLIIKKEYNGLYMGQLQQGEFIGAKIYDHMLDKIYLILGKTKNGMVTGLYIARKRIL